MRARRFLALLGASAFLAAACASLDAVLSRAPRAPAPRAGETIRERWERLGFARFVEVDGVRLHYLDAGAGPPVFFLHGLGDAAIGWRYQLEEFAASGRRVIAWDMMGAGLSGKPPDRAYSVAAMTELFDAFRRRLGVDRADLVGSSYGGAVALLHARRRPETVRALVLLDPACYADEEVLGHARLFEKRWFTGLVWPVLRGRWLARYGLAQCVADFDRLDPAVFRDYCEEAERPGVKEAFVRLEREILPSDPAAFEAGHREIRAPTLILWGRLDRLLPVRQGERLAREIPGAELVVLDCGHLPQLERPEAVNRVVWKFLSSSTRDPRPPK